MKRFYIGGALLSAILHAPLLKDEEYIAFIGASLLWPIPFILWADYIRYATWGQYQHSKNSS